MRTKAEFVMGVSLLYFGSAYGLLVGIGDESFKYEEFIITLKLQAFFNVTREVTLCCCHTPPTSFVCYNSSINTEVLSVLNISFSEGGV